MSGISDEVTATVRTQQACVCFCDSSPCGSGMAGSGMAWTCRGSQTSYTEVGLFRVSVSRERYQKTQIA